MNDTYIVCIYHSNEFSNRNITLKLAYHDNLIPHIFSYPKERNPALYALIKPFFPFLKMVI